MLSGFTASLPRHRGGTRARLYANRSIQMLIWSAVLNGIVAVPIMAVMMVVVTRLSVMGRFSARPTLTFFGWAGTALMAVTVVARSGPRLAEPHSQPSIDREVKSYNARLPSRPGGGIGPRSPAAVSHERSFRDIRQKLSANLACGVANGKSGD